MALRFSSYFFGRAPLLGVFVAFLSVCEACDLDVPGEAVDSSMTINGEKTIIQKNVIRILLKFRSMLAGFNAVVGKDMVQDLF